MLIFLGFAIISVQFIHLHASCLCGISTIVPGYFFGWSGQYCGHWTSDTDTVCQTVVMKELKVKRPGRKANWKIGQVVFQANEHTTVSHATNVDAISFELLKSYITDIEEEIKEIKKAAENAQHPNSDKITNYATELTRWTQKIKGSRIAVDGTKNAEDIEKEARNVLKIVTETEAEAEKIEKISGATIKTEVEKLQQILEKIGGLKIREPTTDEEKEIISKLISEIKEASRELDALRKDFKTPSDLNTLINIFKVSVEEFSKETDEFIKSINTKGMEVPIDDETLKKRNDITKTIDRIKKIHDRIKNSLGQDLHIASISEASTKAIENLHLNWQSKTGAVFGKPNFCQTHLNSHSKRCFHIELDLKDFPMHMTFTDWNNYKYQFNLLFERSHLPDETDPKPGSITIFCHKYGGFTNEREMEHYFRRGLECEPFDNFNDDNFRQLALFKDRRYYRKKRSTNKEYFYVNKTILDGDWTKGRKWKYTE